MPFNSMQFPPLPQCPPSSETAIPFRLRCSTQRNATHRTNLTDMTIDPCDPVQSTGISFLVALSKREYCLMSAVKRVFCSGVATAPLKQARSSPTVMPVGGILERTSSPVGKGVGCACACACVVVIAVVSVVVVAVGGGGGWGEWEGPVRGVGVLLVLRSHYLGWRERK